MNVIETQPVTCTLTGNRFQERLAWIAGLMRTGLCRYRRSDLALELRFTAAAESRVHEWLRLEKECCAFLAFDVAPGPEELRVTITAPEHARSTAVILFDEFVAAADGGA